jgi:hypothetical protein
MNQICIIAFNGVAFVDQPKCRFLHIFKYIEISEQIMETLSQTGPPFCFRPH